MKAPLRDPTDLRGCLVAVRKLRDSEHKVVSVSKPIQALNRFARAQLMAAARLRLFPGTERDELLVRH